MKGRQEIGALKIYEGSVSMEEKRGIRNSIILPTLSYASDVDMECSTANENTCSKSELREKLMWCVTMEWIK